MRYLTAIIMAIVLALISALYVAAPIASFVVRQYSFDSPDSVADLHAAVFMGINVAALIVGFGLGQLIGRMFERAAPKT